MAVRTARREKGRPHDRPAFVSRHRQLQPGRRPAASGAAGAAALEDGRDRGPRARGAGRDGDPAPDRHLRRGHPPPAPPPPTPPPAPPAPPAAPPPPPPPRP